MDLENVPVVSKEEVVGIMKSEGTIVLNVLAPQAYERLHIKGSVSAPYDRLERGEFDDLCREKKTVVYCASFDCGASRKAAALLKERGIDASAYEGGIREWAEFGLPTEGSMSSQEYLHS